MKTLKITTVLVALVIGFLPFSKLENTTATLNLSDVNVIKELSNEQFGCRPSAELKFYVKSAIVKKSRGFHTVEANIYVLDRASGKSNLLASELVMIPKYKDAVLLETAFETNIPKIALKNGDKIVSNADMTPYAFQELIQYESIYKSYLRSTEKLLNQKESI